jgi:hypothetical protein
LARAVTRRPARPRIRTRGVRRRAGAVPRHRCRSDSPADPAPGPGERPGQPPRRASAARPSHGLRRATWPRPCGGAARTLRRSSRRRLAGLRLEGDRVR